MSNSECEQVVQEGMLLKKSILVLVTILCSGVEPFA